MIVGLVGVIMVLLFNEAWIMYFASVLLIKPAIYISQWKGGT
jgi:hypothetical protein